MKIEQKIVIASVLKPINDVRLFHKIAKSILEYKPETQVHIIAFQAEEMPESKVIFHPIFNFQRLNWKRLFANFHFFQKLKKIKPQIIIISTWELLFSSVLFKILFGGKLIYDVQENYFANIHYTQVFPVFLRLPLAYLIRLIELIARPFISKYWLAEKCYQEELGFTRGKAVLLENKVSKEILKHKISFEEREVYKIVYVGTISKDYGIWEAIQFIEKLHQLDSQFYLVIIGHCPQKEILLSLQKKVNKLDFIRLKVSSKPLPQAILLEEMASSQFILMPYQLNKSVQKRIPTKFYEAMALGLSVITSKNEFWEKFASENQSFQAWFWDFQENKNLSYSHIKVFQQTPKNDKTLPNKHIFWGSQFIEIIEKSLKLPSTN